MKTKTIRKTLGRLVLPILLAGVLLLGSGCALVGAGIGAATGATLDYHHPARGAFFGAAIGAITGAVIDDAHYHAHHHAHARRRYVEVYDPYCEW